MHRFVMAAFRDNKLIQEFILRGVVPTGIILGSGSYGSVLEVKYNHFVCAAKKLHDALIEAGNEGVDVVVRRYQQECRLMANLRHPNITQFLGLCFLQEAEIPPIIPPLLVMERLEMSLDTLLECVPNIPLLLKVSFLEGVCCGLVYLHSMQPPVVHRDLTARNVLLTSSLVAKITDLGNSRIINMRPGQLARTLTCVPGTLAYMPPEALSESHCYGTSLDIFSFGHLALYSMTQIFPGNLLSCTYPDPKNPECTLARSEVQRRKVYLDILEELVGQPHHLFVQLIRQCLHNAPERRPSGVEVLSELRNVREEVESECGGSVVKMLDVGKVMLIKELKMKEVRCMEVERRARELEVRCLVAEKTSREQEKQIEELEARCIVAEMYLYTERRARKLEIFREHIEVDKERDLVIKDQQLAQLREVSGLTTEQLQTSQKLLGSERDLAIKDQQLAQLREVSGLTAEQLQTSQELLGSERDLAIKDQQLAQLRLGSPKPGCNNQEGGRQVQFPLDMEWTNRPDMPFAMDGYIQSVIVLGTIYVGGGYAGRGSDNNYIVMTYDTCSPCEWHQLPPYRAKGFSMAVVNNQLLLAGGRERNNTITKRISNSFRRDHRDIAVTNLLGVWETDGKKWTHPYPPMPTARSGSSVVAYKQWLLVAGGVSCRVKVSTVDVLDVDSLQWWSAPSMPTPLSDMRSTILGDMWYIMVGDVYNIDKVYSVSVPALLSHSNFVSSRNKSYHLWNIMSGLGLIFSTPICIGGSLLAVGGKNVKDCKAVTAIHRYLPEIEEWVVVGELPSPLYHCTCAVISAGEVFVAGGVDISSGARVHVHVGYLI